MRTLLRNQTTFYYALYQGKEEILDDDGYKTGEQRVKYSDWVSCSGNISASKGEAQVELFGISEQYDKTIVMDDINCPIDETTVLCIDIAPANRKDGTPIYDYIVKKKAKSLNFVSYAISKVKVDVLPEPEPTPTPQPDDPSESEVTDDAEHND